MYVHINNKKQMEYDNRFTHLPLLKPLKYLNFSAYVDKALD